MPSVRIYIAATSCLYVAWRCIDVNATLFERHVSAGYCCCYCFSAIIIIIIIIIITPIKHFITIIISQRHNLGHSVRDTFFYHFQHFDR